MLWKRIVAGRPSVVLGGPVVWEGLPSVELLVLDGGTPEPFGAILALERALALPRGSNSIQPGRAARQGIEAGGLLRAAGLAAHAGLLGDQLARFAATSALPVAVVFRRADAADRATLMLLRHLVLRSEPLPAALVFEFSSRVVLSPAARDLLEAIELLEGEDAVLTGESLPPEAPRSGTAFAMPRSSDSADGDRPSESRRSLERVEAAERLAAAAKHVASARTLSTRGAYAAGFELAQKALALLESVPESAECRELRLRATIELARIRWQGHVSDDFDSRGVLELLGHCQRELAPDDPQALRIELGCLIADVCSEIGTPECLARARNQLADATEELLSGGRLADVVHVLNKQAQVCLKLSETENAEALLSRARSLLDELDPDEEVLEEIAESQQLYARRLIHLDPSLLDGPSLRIALSSAAEAGRLYDILRRPREVARVWDTLGRLERLAGRPTEAWRHLSAALELQRRIGDLAGAARSTAALSELSALRGEYRTALELLEQSVASNAAKGSLLGLAYNRWALRTLRGALPPNSSRELEPMLELLGGRIEQGRAAAEARQAGTGAVWTVRSASG